MKKFELNLELRDEKDKRRALKTVSALSGINEITIDMKNKKLTVVGTVDPTSAASKLRKRNWQAKIISVELVKEPEKKEEAKNEEPKIEETEREEAAKKEEEKKPGPEQMLGVVMPYRPYYHPSMQTYYHAHQSMEENPNACAIC